MNITRYLGDVAERDWEHQRPQGHLRFALVGLGSFTRNTALPAIDVADYCEATVCVTGSPEDATALTRKFDALDHVLTYEEFHDGAASEHYDAVYVCTPNAAHLEFAETAAELGKHVLCEKPMEATVERAERMVAVCADNDVRLMVGYRMQTDPVLRRLREIIADGGIGDPVQVHGSFSFRILENGGPDQWRLDRDLAGGGALMDIGLYPLNTTRFLLEDDPIAVQAAVSSPDEGFEDVDEHVAFQLRFPDGVTASCTASYNGYVEHSLQIVGTEGRIRVDDAFTACEPRQVSIETDGTHVELTGPALDEVTELFDYFAYHVLREEDVRPDGHDGLVDMRVTDAVYESAEIGGSVSIE